jgi:hypothetical protein
MLPNRRGLRNELGSGLADLRHRLLLRLEGVSLMTRSRGKPDKNAATLVALWRACGGEWYYMPPDMGFDGIAVFYGTAIVEIKDGALPPSERKLTANEQTQRAKIEARGVTYHLWQCDDDVLRMLDEMRNQAT